MTTEVKFLPYPPYRIITRQVVKQVKEHLSWVSCPRCIGGNMYPENNREYVCMQCGYHSYHGKSANRLSGEALQVSMK